MEKQAIFSQEHSSENYNEDQKQQIDQEIKECQEERVSLINEKKKNLDEMMIEHVFNKNEEDQIDDFDEETIQTMGTDKQTKIISNYPCKSPQQKFKIPFIEKQNGNLCIKSITKLEQSQEKEESKSEKEIQKEIKSQYRVAISFYNKALLALKMIFEDQNQGDQMIIKDQNQAIDLIKNIEIPVCLNLALCYLKTQQYHYSLKYCDQIIDKNVSPQQMNGGIGTLEKVYYRRGLSYFNIGELKKAKDDFMFAINLSKDIPNYKVNQAIYQGLKDIKTKQDENKEKEKKMSQRMFKFQEKSVQKIEQIEENLTFIAKIINLIIEIFIIIYGYIFWHVYAFCEYLIFKILFEIKIINIGENSQILWDKYFKNNLFFSHILDQFHPSQVKKYLILQTQRFKKGNYEQKNKEIVKISDVVKKYQ